MFFLALPCLVSCLDFWFFGYPSCLDLSYTHGQAGFLKVQV